MWPQGEELEVLADCDRCNRLARCDEWLSDAQFVALKRGLSTREVVEFILWWYHDASHPRGDWRPTGYREMPAVLTV